MHEIESNDGLVLADTAAWHGLGKVVKGAPNPFAALRLARLEWEVMESKTIAGSFEDCKVSTDAHKMLVRSDDHTVLGLVGSDYRPVQNTTLAEIAYGFRKAGTEQGVEVESAGSIRGGKRVWMLIRAASIDMTGQGDEAVPYLMIANSHDGTMALRVLPTSVRVVCSNTFHAALAARGTGWSFRHTLNIGDKVDTLANDIKRWMKTVEDGREVATALAAKQVNRETVRNLWSDVLTALDGEIPESPKNGWEERKRDHAIRFLARCAEVFDKESQQYGANLWVAANAATNAVQHLRSEWSLRGKNAQDRKYAAWDGSVADDTARVFALAREAR